MAGGDGFGVVYDVEEESHLVFGCFAIWGWVVC